MIVWPSLVKMTWLGFFGSSLDKMIHYRHVSVVKFCGRKYTHRVLSNSRVSNAHTFNFFCSSTVARCRPAKLMATLRIEKDAERLDEVTEVVCAVV